MKHFYPLCAAERLQDHKILEYNRPQEVNICVCMTIRAGVDFGLLKHCIQLEYARQESLRIRFTKRDENGKVFQYFASYDPRDIRLVDFRGKSQEEINATLEEWSSQPFEQVDSPMNEFIMVAMPDGYNGIYLRIDHRLTDSTGMILMINDIMGLYCHFAYGAPMPEDPPPYHLALEKDLAKEENASRTAKDRAFWEEQVAVGEPIYTDVTGCWKLDACRKKYNNPNLRAADREMNDLRVGRAIYHLEPEPTKRLMDYCMENEVSMTNLLLMGLRTYLSKMNDGEKDVTVRNYVSRRSTLLNKTSGGTRTHCFPCRTILEPETEFLDGVRMIQDLQNTIYRDVDFDPLEVTRMFQERYHPPKNTTYDSVALTYQPLPMRLQNEQLHGIPFKSDWLTNGTAIQKVYLTVMHSATDLGLQFYFKYQLAELSPHDMELMYYYLMKILFMGVENPDMTVGEILRTV